MFYKNVNLKVKGCLILPGEVIVKNPYLTLNLGTA